MASPGTLEVQATRTGEAMSMLILPETFVPLLAAFVLETDARRWTLKVTFHYCRPLGIAASPLQARRLNKPAHQPSTPYQPPHEGGTPG